ncbi:YncE family protein [Altererythrobacter xixiisoli]|uniref:YncE family protein n=1 Tax=Croceibacterium xixiisoli TaxID=1476466 RepID=A0A6I4TUS1_9SPHN|nr:YncE family protein [Croceibacterium xixiisoli]MXO99552.1 YncE family protein [Croceibacterium xixiisoli]
MFNSTDLASQAPETQDGEGAALMRRVELAPALYQIAYSARVDAVFVAAAGGWGGDTRPSVIYRLDPRTLAVEAEIPMERNGLGLTLDDAAGRLYVGNALHASVTVIDIATNQLIGVAQLAEKVTAPGFDGQPTERYPHNLRELVLDRRHNRLFAPGIWITDSVLYVMNTETLALEKVLPGFGFGVAGAALDEDAGKLYVSNMQGQLLTVDTTSLELDRVQEIAADQLLNLTLDRATGHVLATDHGGENPDKVRAEFAKIAYEVRGPGHRVVAIDPISGDVVSHTSTGELPVALLIDEPRNRLWVTNRGSGTVTVHDSRDHRLLQSFDLPIHPNSLALDQASGAVFVTIKNPMTKDSTDIDRAALESVARIEF